MSVLNRESISRAELALRINKHPEELDRAATAASEEKLSALMISYYFKGGHGELGCEFIHKSFREYLFAEQIVEIIKEYGRSTWQVLKEREVYWKDFAEGDARRVLSEDLAHLLSPQWLTVEVWNHVEDLIQWEVGRAFDDEKKSGGMPTAAIDPDAWSRIREGLADVWDWWAEGVHMRPQPERMGPRKQLSYSPPRANQWVEWASPLADEVSLEPVRTITLDARLGEALLRIACRVHFQIADATGWIKGDRTPEDLWREDATTKSRRCQTVVTDGAKRWVLFAPAKPNPKFFVNYASRFNADGWRPYSLFPLMTDLPGIDLRNAVLILTDPVEMLLSKDPLLVASFGLGWAVAAPVGTSLLKALRMFLRPRLQYANLAGAKILHAASSASVVPKFLDSPLKWSLAAGLDLKGAFLGTQSAKGAQEQDTADASAATQ